MPSTSTTRLSLTHWLTLSLLAATQKPGQWVILPAMVRPALRALAERGLVRWQQATRRTCEAVLTDAGREAVRALNGEHHA
jgi:DNA-binding MarR family transcriptional regulator